MTHIKRQKLISSTRVRGYNKNCVLWPQTWVDEINFYRLYVAWTMGLARYYETEGFFYIYKWIWL